MVRRAVNPCEAWITNEHPTFLYSMPQASTPKREAPTKQQPHIVPVGLPSAMPDLTIGELL